MSPAVEKIVEKILAVKREKHRGELRFTYDKSTDTLWIECEKYSPFFERMIAIVPPEARHSVDGRGYSMLRNAWGVSGDYLETMEGLRLMTLKGSTR